MCAGGFYKRDLQILKKSEEVTSELIPEKVWGSGQNITSCIPGYGQFRDKRNCMACPQITITRYSSKAKFKDEEKGLRPKM